MPPSTPEDVVVESVRFAAGPHLLEGELAYDADVRTPRGAVVLACSHPLLGGNMHNNVIRGLGDGLAEQQLITLRFNYRGVGGSQGPPVDVARHVAQFWETSHVSDELDLWRDLQATVAFLRSAVDPALPLALVGYSFGCSLLPRAVPAGTPTPLVLIAPTVGTHGYDVFESALGPKLVIAPEGDFAADPECLRQWFARLPGPRRLVPARGDGHFFRGHERWLVETVSGFLHDQWR